ncbi:hypothetical protein Q7P37_000233 [Cladosporium fusiforme]
MKKVAARLNALMERIHDFQAMQANDRKKFRYRVVKTNQNDVARRKKFQSYTGPDVETVSMLEQNAEAWTSNPASFWNYVQGTAPELGSVQSIDATAQMLHLHANLGLSLKHASKTLEKMIARGNSYKYLERTLGVGVCFVLGTSLSETHWTKLLAKSTPESAKAIDQIRNTPVMSLGERFGPVQVEAIRSLKPKNGQKKFSKDGWMKSAHLHVVSGKSDEPTWQSRKKSSTDDPLPPHPSTTPDMSDEGGHPIVQPSGKLCTTRHDEACAHAALAGNTTPSPPPASTGPTRHHR